MRLTVYYREHGCETSAGLDKAELELMVRLALIQMDNGEVVGIIIGVD